MPLHLTKEYVILIATSHHQSQPAGPRHTLAPPSAENDIHPQQFRLKSPRSHIVRINQMLACSSFQSRSTQEARPGDPEHFLAHCSLSREYRPKTGCRVFAKQSENLVGIKTRFPNRKEAEGAETKGYSLCVFIPDLVGYGIKHLSTKWRRVSPNSSRHPLPTTSHIHTTGDRAGQGEGDTCLLAKGPMWRRRLLETCPTTTDRCRTSMVSWVTVMG